jgi:lysophospholipase L1-like esterase
VFFPGKKDRGLKLKKKVILRVAAAFVVIAAVAVVGASGAFIYNGTAKVESTGLTDDELDEFYNTDGASTGDMYEGLSEDGTYTFTFPGRTLTSEVVAYDGKERTIVCWGDSMTEGIGASYAVLELGDGETMDISYWTYPYALEYFTGIPVFNFGTSGENSEEIAIRAGGIKLYTDRDVVVGYHHSADVKVLNENGVEEYVQNYGGYGNFYDNDYGVVYIENQMYTLNGASFDDDEQAYNIVDLSLMRFDDSGGYYSTWYVNPSAQTWDTVNASVTAAGIVNASATAEISAGSNISETAQDVMNYYVEYSYDQTITAQEAMEQYGVDYYEEFWFDGDMCVVIPAGTLVTPRAAQDHSDDILIIEIGSNGGWHNDYAELVAQIDSIIERYNNPYYIIIGDTDDPGDSADANQGLLDANGNKIGRSDTYWEAALRQAYGEHFLNMREYMITNGLRDAGLLTTKRDLRYFQAGMISKKLRADWTHFNSYGYYSKAKAIYLKGVALGYWE